MLQKLQNLVTSIDRIGLVQASSFFLKKRMRGTIIINLSDLQHPIFLRSKTSDVSVFAEIFIDKEYNFKLNFDPKIIIDGGANIGLASVYFKNRFPEATIIAVEPDSENIAVLKSNVKGYEKIHVKQAGLWSKKTRTKLVDKHNYGHWGLITEEVDDTNTNSADDGINTLTIKDIMDEFQLTHIDLLKLDIESAERKVFEEDYMSWLPKTKVIVIELHDWLTKGCSRSFFSAINEGFKSYTFSQSGESIIIRNDDWQPE